MNDLKLEKASTKKENVKLPDEGLLIQKRE